MGELSMATDEREAFLADVHVGVLSVERADGPPLTVPVWYRYTPGGVVEVNTEAESLKGRLVRAAGRASLCAQREEMPYAYVSVDGPVAVVPATDEGRLSMAVRYLGEEMGQAYVDNAPAADEVVLRLTPERWFSVDYAGLDLGG
ncbi:TIGR03618 family F420-dependent PPOX class oxidoreductase [Iamia majanohamensis]|uniref:TIGR03618 family F420-dependent PPOX class oxidoreductase n=1 Tax=Iamia majanohamensis TaxID=467976 RepID=A0AAE9Y9S9_9ACTN|nr:TIGR03618 family F420-dependent PPOX class oxidoreductase [Iamia majanohamensis]WCO68446.1 TIGR03618 family F420-dependent PPOX class oxidoreductase [Iamia majanohamensis]